MILHCCPYHNQCHYCFFISPNFVACAWEPSTVTCPQKIWVSYLITHFTIEGMRQAWSVDQAHRMCMGLWNSGVWRVNTHNAVQWLISSYISTTAWDQKLHEFFHLLKRNHVGRHTICCGLNCVPQKDMLSHIIQHLWMGFGNRVFADVIKIKSCLIRVGLNPIWPVSL